MHVHVAIGKPYCPLSMLYAFSNPYHEYCVWPQLISFAFRQKASSALAALNLSVLHAVHHLACCHDHHVGVILHGGHI